MINIKTLIRDDQNRSVIYTDGTGETESGYIPSWNDRFIFVDYGNSCGRGVATSPEDLKWTLG